MGRILYSGGDEVSRGTVTTHPPTSVSTETTNRQRFPLALHSPQTASETVGNPPGPRWISPQNLPSCPPLRPGRPRRTAELCSRTASPR